MDLRSDSRFEYQGDIVVIVVNMPEGQRRNRQRGKSGTNFAYSINDSVTFGDRYFFIMRIFRGGEGHCRDSKSLVFVSILWSTEAPNSIELHAKTYQDIEVLSCLVDAPHLGFPSAERYC